MSTAYEIESIQNRARDIEATTCRMLYGATHTDSDCISATISVPLEVFPDGLRPLAAAIHELAAAGRLIDYSTIVFSMIDAGIVDASGLLDSVAREAYFYASCAPDLDAAALLKVHAIRDSANKLGLISEIVNQGDLEAARHAFADLAPFEYIPGPVEALPFADIENAGPIPDPLFRGGIYPGCLNLFIGESNAGKSMLALTGGLALATGQVLIKSLDPIQRGRVLYLSGEDDARVLKQRIADIARAHNLDTTGAVLHFVDRVSPLIEFDAAGLAHTTQAWRELKRKAADYDMIVIDPLVSWFALTGENNASEVGRLAEMLKDLAAQSGAAVLLTHHTNKGGASNLDQAAARGSSALPAAARFVANVARPTQEHLERLGLAPEDGARFVRFAISKNSYGPTTGAAAIFERVQGGALIDADPYAARRGDLAESLASILADAGARLTRREIIQGRGDIAKDVRGRLEAAEGKVTRQDLECAIEHGLRFGLLREQDAETGAQRKRREVVPNA